MLEDLTRRERKIIGLLITGLSNQGIAKKLKLTNGEVNMTVARIVRKLGIKRNGPFHVRCRIIYVLCYHYGMLEGWPKP